MRTVADHRSNPRIWVVALCLSLLFHAGAMVALGRMKTARLPEAAQAPSQPIEFVFAPREPAGEGPRVFTELPEDRRDEAPERADFLSNLASRARDLLLGGDEGSLPASDGRSEAPHVAMLPGDPAPPVPSVDEAADEAGNGADAGQPPPLGEVPDAGAPRGQSSLADRIARSLGAPDGSAASRDPLAALRKRDARPAESRAAGGNSDIHQEAFSNLKGNAILLGDLSMNTTAWINGFWMQRFKRDVYKNWVAPYAYEIGVIHGWTIVEMEVHRSGKLLRLVAIGEEGHYTLKEASLEAIRASAPFPPLPKDFPEETFTVQIKMIYADYRR